MLARKPIINALYIICLIAILASLYMITSMVVKNNFKNAYQSTSNVQKKILLVWGFGFGEKEHAYQAIIAARNIGVDLKVVSAKTNGSILKHFVANPPLEAATYMQPDFILTVERSIPAIEVTNNYIVLDRPKALYIYKKIGKSAIYNNLRKFSGFLVAFPEIDQFREIYETDGNKFYGFSWYPTSHQTNFKPQAPKKLFYPGGILLDTTRGSDKYKNIFSRLDKTGYLEVSGSKAMWQHTPASIRAPLPFDGISLLRAQNTAGVTLILHDREHFKGNVPTGRIFEAAAANTVIISDRLKFIEQNFGNHVLYIDVDQDENTIATQIENHMHWIFTHPNEAMAMAEKCHAIFTEKFTLEKQLQNLINLDNQIKGMKYAVS